MKFLFDLFPLLLFFGAFKLYDIYVATAVAIAATFVQVGIFWIQNRRFETMHLITLGVICLFGGMTLIFQNDAFIKWKPTVINGIFAIIILILLGGKRTAMEYLMGNQIDLPKSTWRLVNISWAIFFIFLGVLNLYFAFYHNPGADPAVREEIWVNFKVFGLMGLTIAFTIIQMLFIAKYIRPKEDEAPDQDR